MADNLKTFRSKVLDPKTSFSEVRHLFCQLIRNHPRDLPLIIRAMGLLYANRSWYSQPPSDDASHIFHTSFVPFLTRNKKLLLAFSLMIVDCNVPHICLLAVINAIKRGGKDPWRLIEVAIDLRPSFADRIFRRRVASPKRDKRGSKTT